MTTPIRPLYRPRLCPICGLEGCAHPKKAEDPKKISLPKSKHKHYRSGITVVPDYLVQSRLLRCLEGADRDAKKLNDPRAVALIEEALAWVRKKCEVEG